MPYVIADDLPHEPAGVRFRRLLDRPEILQMPGAHLGIAAVIEQKASSEALFASASAWVASRCLPAVGVNRVGYGTWEGSHGGPRIGPAGLVSVC